MTDVFLEGTQPINASVPGAYLVRAIEENYSLDIIRIQRIYAGLGSRNWAVQTSSGRYFAKEFLSKDSARIGTSSISVGDHCIENGIMSPRVVKNGFRESVTNLISGGVALFEFIAEDEKVDKLSADFLSVAGTNLAKVHMALSSYPNPGRDETEEWLSVSVEGIKHNIQNVLDAIDNRIIKNGFDVASASLLQKRMVQLDKYRDLSRPLETLTRGIIHGDYGQKNLIVDTSHDLWVIDFGGGGVFLPSYELGRAAFPPENFVEADWLVRGLNMIKSYSVIGFLSKNDLIFCARAWMIQLLQSLYGVKQNYFCPHEFQSEINEFWLLRARAAEILFDSLEEVEQSIIEDLC